MIVFRAATDIYWGDGVRVIAAHLDAQGKLYAVAEPAKFTMKQIQPHDLIAEPTFQFTADEAKNLMTALWEAGVRPANVPNASGEINRIEAHLADMRRLVFKDSSIPQPQQGAAHKEKP